MRYRKLDANGDYSFGNQQNDFWINVPEAVAQAVETSLKLFVGEWFLNIESGVPYPESILGKHSKDEADATLIGQITNVPGVVSLVNYQSELDPNTRSYKTINGTINTVYGLTEVEIVNEQNF